MEAREKEVWDFGRAQSLAKASKVLRKMAEGSRTAVARMWSGDGENDDDEEKEEDNSNKAMEVDQLKLGNLLKRRKVGRRAL